MVTLRHTEFGEVKSSMKRLRCAIIGAGVVGVATAYALARRGAEVTLYEQYDLHHNRGSSHGATRMLRTAYYEHPNYVPLVQRTTVLWRDLEAKSKQSLFQQTGVMLAGYEDGALIPGTLKAASEHGLTLEHLSHQQAAEQYGCFSFPKEMKVIKEHDAGVIFADKAFNALLKGAINIGVTIKSQCPVQRWEASSGGVKIITQDNVELYDRVIISTGAWANELLGDIGASVTPVIKTLFWIPPGDEQLTIKGGFIPFAVETKDLRFFYGFPAVGEEGVKLGEHTGGYTATHSIDELPKTVFDQDAEDLKNFLTRFAPKLAQPLINNLKCLYEASSDRHFIIDHHPHDERVCFAVGLSGHGFKFAPVIGEALADLAGGKRLEPEFQFLSLERFAQPTNDGPLSNSEFS